MKIQFLGEEYEVPVIPQWENYRYEADLQCHCGATECRKGIVGIAEVNGDMMMCCECPQCFDKFRAHISHDSKWRDHLGLSLHLCNKRFLIKKV